MAQKPFLLKSWEEDIGPDSSIVNVVGGKRAFKLVDKTVSSINLPLYAPSLYHREPQAAVAVAVDSNHHLWRSYRQLLNEGRGVGKKMYTAATPLQKFQAGVRTGMRDKLKDALLKEETIKRDHYSERASLKQRHGAHKEAEQSYLRSRCSERGIEGIYRPTLRTPAPDAPLDEAVVSAAVRKGFGRSDGKRVVQRDDADMNFPPFGPPLRAESEPMRRWDKILL
jgi:hypothetical protein